MLLCTSITQTNRNVLQRPCILDRYIQVTLYYYYYCLTRMQGKLKWQYLAIEMSLLDFTDTTSEDQYRLWLHGAIAKNQMVDSPHWLLQTDIHFSHTHTHNTWISLKAVMHDLQSTTAIDHLNVFSSLDRWICNRTVIAVKYSNKAFTDQDYCVNLRRYTTVMLNGNTLYEGIISGSQKAFWAYLSKTCNTLIF